VPWLRFVLGVALVATGVVWIVQGLGSLHGSFMTGSPFWAWMGVLAVAVGLPIGVVGMVGVFGLFGRRPRRTVRHPGRSGSGGAG